MSYCRWSTDQFRCDLYCYESADGFVTHVAGNRHVGEIPEVDHSLIGAGTTQEQHREYLRQTQAQYDWLDDCERRPIGGPHDGESFVDGTLEEFRGRLVSLREAGYQFPDGVLECVDYEINHKTDELEG